MRIGFRSPDDLTGLLIDRENDGAISRSATQSTRRGPWGEPAKAVNQPHIASDNDQVSFDIRCVAGALRDKTRDREIVHIILSPDQLPGEAVQFGQVAGHVIEVDISTVDGRSGRDAALGIACRSRVGCCLVEPLDPELTHGLVVDRPPLETPGIQQINSFRERRNLYRQQQQGETLPALHGGETEHECLRGHVEKCCKVPASKSLRLNGRFGVDCGPQDSPWETALVLGMFRGKLLFLGETTYAWCRWSQVRIPRTRPTRSSHAV